MKPAKPSSLKRLAHRARHQQRIRRRRGAEPRREVHRAPEHREVQPLARPDRPHHHLAGSDADPDVQVPLRMRLEQAHQRVLYLEAGQHRAPLHALALEHRHHLVADELVDVAVVPLDDHRLGVEILVEHLHHHFRRHHLGEGGIAADVGEEQRRPPPLAGPRHPGRIRGRDRAHRLARDELHQLQPLAELPDHRVHPEREIAELVRLRTRFTRAARSPAPTRFGDLADLQDRPGKPPREEQRRRRGRPRSPTRPTSSTLRSIWFTTA